MLTTAEIRAFQPPTPGRFYKGSGFLVKPHNINGERVVVLEDTETLAQAYLSWSEFEKMPCNERGFFVEPGKRLGGER
jgi:hypothetical protein